jgi:hypothetical protein
MAVQPVSRYTALAKRAGVTYNPKYDPDFAANEELRRDAANKLAKVLLISLGSGVAAGGITGLYKLLKPRKLPYTRGSALQNVPIPVSVGDEKLAADESWLGKLQGALGSGIYKLLGDMTPEQWAEGDFMRGSSATSTAGIPWYIGAMIPGAAAVGYGGWKAMDALLNSQRDAEQAEELARAKQLYKKRMAENLKLASAELDQLAEHWTKQAGVPGATSPPVAGPIESAADAVGGTGAVNAYRNARSGAADFAGGATGVYAALAALLTTAAGIAAYKQFSKRTDRGIVDEALEQRARKRTGEIPPVYLQAVPQ